MRVDPGIKRGHVAAPCYQSRIRGLGRVCLKWPGAVIIKEEYLVLYIRHLVIAKNNSCRREQQTVQRDPTEAQPESYTSF